MSEPELIEETHTIHVEPPAPSTTWRVFWICLTVMVCVSLLCETAYRVAALSGKVP